MRRKTLLSWPVTNGFLPFRCACTHTHTYAAVLKNYSFRHMLASFCLAVTILSQPALAEKLVMEAIPNTRIVGVGRMSFMFWDIYDAKLYTSNGQWPTDKPFMLSLHYFRDFDGLDIADRSIKEMRGQGFKDDETLAKWHKEMNAIFPDVKKDTVLTAVFFPGKHTEFFENGRSIGTIKGDDFLRHFSGIWLNERTSEPSLRKKLLGQS